MTHDYKAAIEFMDRYFSGKTVYDGHPLLTLYQALRIADKLMQEPSAGMYDAADGYGMCMEDHGVKEYVTDVYTAMRDQLLKEVDDEN